MYSDDEEKRGFPVRDFLIKLVVIIIIVLLIMWLLPINKGKDSGTDLSPLTDRIFNANLQEMKEAAIPYFTTERLPEEGKVVKLTLQEMLDKKLLLPFTDKNGDTCDTKNSYVTVEDIGDEYLMTVHLKCNDDEGEIVVYLGCYDYCANNGVCEKQEKENEDEKEPVKTGPSCTLEITSGTTGSNGWYVGNVKVQFKSKKTTSSGAKITSYGISTSSTATYNKENSVTITKDGTSKVYGYVKDSSGKTAVCTITVKKDTTKPKCNLTILSGTKNENGKYVGNVKVGFSSKTDAGSGVSSYGISTSSKADYNGKQNYTISKVGTTKVYGYVKDKAGHTSVCSTSVTIEETKSVVSKPSCELQVTSGTLGNNNWYTSNIVVSFKNKTTTNGASIVKFGIGTSENYSGANNYTLSADGTHIIKGYVEDSNGYKSTCSITVKRDATKPSCSLSVISGTKNDSDQYTSDIKIGFKSKTDATSGMNSYGIGKSTTYQNNTSYIISTDGTYTINGYVKDNAGNTNVCSIKVTKKTATYEYQYSKNIPTTYSAWSAWKTDEYNCAAPPSFKATALYQAEDLGSTKVIASYDYALGKSIIATRVKETGRVSEKSCKGWTYYRSAASTTTKTYAINVASDWKYVDTVSLSSPPTDTLSTKYEFVGMDWNRCGDTCTSTPYTYYKKYTRDVSTVTATDTIPNGSNVSVACKEWETKETILFSTYTITVGYETTRTINYKDMCTYKYRTRTITKEAYTDYKWSSYNNQTLLNDGYKMTGNKRLAD